MASPEVGDKLKKDFGKPRFDLIPAEAMHGLASLYERGARKYADRGWEEGMDFHRLFSAMERHAWKWFMGDDYDEVDGQHHLLSVAWCAIALYTYQCRGMEQFDDRPKNSTLAHCEAFWSKN